MLDQYDTYQATGNNGSVSTNKNAIIFVSRNHNNKKEYRIKNPLPIKDTNVEGPRVTNKDIQCNKEPIPTLNAYSEKSNKNKNTEHIKITTGRNTKISRPYETNIKHSKKKLTKYNTNVQQQQNTNENQFKL